MEVVTWSLPHAGTTHVQLMAGGEDAKSTAKAKPNAGTLYTFCIMFGQTGSGNKHHI